MTKTVTVTGATGFIGSNLALFLQQKGYRIFCPVRSLKKAGHLQKKGISCFEEDLLAPQRLADAIGASSIVFHLAGTIKGVTAEDYTYGNLETTRSVSDLIRQNRRNHCRLIYLSSQAAAGPGTYDQMRNEEDPPQPVSQYGRSKLAAENYLLDHFPEATILRPGIVYGPRDRETLQLFQYARFGFIPTAGFRSFHVNMIYIDDLAEIMETISCCTNSCGQTYFVHDGNAYEWSEICREVGFSMGKRIKVLPFPMAVIKIACASGGFWGKICGHAPYLNRDKWQEISQKSWLCDCSKLHQELSCKPRHRLQDALKTTFSWYTKKGWL